MDLPVGPPVPPKEAVSPSRTPLPGRSVSLVPLTPDHAPALWRHLGGDANRWRWTYMLGAGFPTYPSCEEAIATWSASRDPLFYAVVVSGEALGLMSYMSVVPAHRRIEIGSVILGERLQRSRAATEAFYLLLRRAFEDLGYLRVEWKANALNEPSLAAARRLGFAFEGVFRKHMVVKGRQRDTAYFSITDAEWPAVKGGLEAWLADGNFDEHGKQKRGLRECREAFKQGP
ncbi:Uncharacterized protein TOPH_06132 [Tolypocladium ophioglossoides CBS 100239]|uniref:N-acetyltransferase domain-containing protein n=1 Tax=Tolypocladium ophioglossoides (strain CBS 100239) TaxID=1163406 RepID=A0A0L0N577_TOLOC|nr:Uncharacterized protein TOPH_06132 [Tolypocladium ophioglossoides CBS 100239]